MRRIDSPVQPSGEPRPPRQARGVVVADRARDPPAHRAQRIHCQASSIPTCEALAAEFGANKNTVSKAYRSLAQRGYLLTRAGFGTFISKRPVRVDLDSALDGIAGLLSLAVQEAKLSGLGQAQFRQVRRRCRGAGLRPRRTAHRLHRMQPSRRDDAEPRPAGRDLASRSSRCCIDDVLADPERFLAEYDILAVNITHLSAIESALGARHRRRTGARRSSACTSRSIPTACLRVARLRAGTKVGIVCDLRQTLVVAEGHGRRLQPGAHGRRLPVEGARGGSPAASRRATSCSSRRRRPGACASRSRRFRSSRLRSGPTRARSSSSRR